MSKYFETNPFKYCAVKKWKIELSFCTQDRAEQIGRFLDANGYDSENAFKKVLDDNNKYKAVS